MNYTEYIMWLHVPGRSNIQHPCDTPGLEDSAPSWEDVHLDDGYKDAALSHLR